MLEFLNWFCASTPLYSGALLSPRLYTEDILISTKYALIHLHHSKQNVSLCFLMLTSQKNPHWSLNMKTWTCHINIKENAAVMLTFNSVNSIENLCLRFKDQSSSAIRRPFSPWSGGCTQTCATPNGWAVLFCTEPKNRKAILTRAAV